MEIFGIIIKATALLLVLIAAFEDFRHMRIRNDICIAIVALFVPYAITLEWHEIALHLVSCGIIFAITAAMFFAGLFGGGDAKFLGALALWFAPIQLFPFTLIMALTGGVLALAAITIKRTDILSKISATHPRILGPQDGWLAALHSGKTVVPYGIAIAFAALLTFF